MLRGIETKAETKGGIIIPERMRHPVNQGIIVAKGNDVSKTDRAFDLGNVVVHTMYSDSAIEVEEDDPAHVGRSINVRYTIVAFDQVICSDYGYFASLQETK
jgi:co-chaperonin GroES (HSP10)